MTLYLDGLLGLTFNDNVKTTFRRCIKFKVVEMSKSIKNKH